jgi:hypothetical protein
MACKDCVTAIPIKKGESGCKGSKPKITDVRYTCCEDTVETLAASPNANCPVGYIDDIIAADLILNPTPYKSVDIFNQDEIDELNDFTFDRATDFGEDTFSINLGIKIYDADQDCAIQQLKGQDICVAYRIDNLSGDWIWRRFTGKVTAISGGLINGYTLTVDIIDPADEERPLYINFGTATLTDAGLDAITEF